MIKHITSTLTRTKTLWILFAATLLLTLGFAAVMQVWGFGIIDEISNPDQLAAHLAQMTDQQKTVHAWMTASLDVAYPFAYGGLFIGMALRFFGKAGPYLAMPGALVIPVDLAEGVVQVLLLTGTDQVLDLKSWITPLKLGLYSVALIIALVALIVAIVQQFRARKK